MTCLCFIRIYFVANAFFNWLPFNLLYGKRVCQEAGFEPDFSFQVRAAFKKYPYVSFFTLATLCVTVDAYIIRIWERPYFELAFDPSYYEFKSFSSSVWYTIISMTSVGYGNIVASTHIGRACAVVTIINGAFLLALLVGLIIDWFKLDSNKI